MKFRILIFLSLLIGLATIISCDPQTEEPPKIITEELAGGNFDKWVTQTQGDVNFEKPAGDWWDGLNYLSVIGGPITTTKTEDAYAGKYALRLETKWWGEDLTIPGILASGYFDPDSPIGENLIIGRPYTKKPKSLNGYMKYFPADNDTLVIFIALTKFNTNTLLRDTIGRGEYTYSGEISPYTPFSINLEYSQNVNPDSVHIIILASASGKEMRGHAGSILFVDELKFIYE